MLAWLLSNPARAGLVQARPLATARAIESQQRQQFRSASPTAEESFDIAAHKEKLFSCVASGSRKEKGPGRGLWRSG